MKISHFWTMAFVAGMGLAACHGGHHDHDGDARSEQESHETEHHHHGKEVVILAPEKARALGVETEVARRGTFHGVIHTSGKVMAASCDETTVVATISGRVAHVGHESEGMAVEAGTRLFSITSAGMQQADGDPILRARIEYEKAKHDYERALQLVENKIISEKDFALTKAEYEAAELTYTSISKNRSEGGVVVKSPGKGYVKQCLVKEGDYVEAGEPLMVITKNQHLYLRAEVPERNFGELGRIQGAKFRTSYSDRLFDIAEMGGHIQSYGRTEETGSSYIPVVFEFNNTGAVVQGSYAEIYLMAGKRDSVLTIPVSALTEEQGLHYVYIQDDEDGYHKQEVELGMDDGERIEILKGLTGGELVVVKGAVQVKLASATHAIPAHSHHH